MCSGWPVSDDDELDELPPPVQFKRQSSYDVMDADDLERHVRNQVGKAAARLDVSPSVACVLLRHCGWDAQQLEREWEADKDAVATAAGALLHPADITSGAELPPQPRTTPLDVLGVHVPLLRVFTRSLRGGRPLDRRRRQR